METRPLAHQHVPGLERLGGRRIVDGLVDAAMDAHHRVDVVVLLPADLLLAGDAGLQGLAAFGLRSELRHDLLAALGLPARLQLGRPLLIGLPVVADVDRRRGALEHVHALGRRTEVRDDLDGAGPGADDAHSKVAELLEIAAGELVVPAGGVERVPPEALHAVDSSEARLGERAVRADHELRPHRVAAVGGDVPARGLLVPDGRRDGCLEHGEVVEVVLRCDRLAVGEDLGALGVVAGGHIVHLVEERQIVVRHHVARDARIPVPVPGAADVGASFDDADALDALLAEAGRREQRREPTADEEHVDHLAVGVDDRLSLDPLVGVRIAGEFGHRAVEVAVHVGARRAVAEAEVALLGEPRLDRVVVLLRVPVPPRRHVELERELVVLLGLVARIGPGRHGRVPLARCPSTLSTFEQTDTFCKSERQRVSDGARHHLRLGGIRRGGRA